MQQLKPFLKWAGGKGQLLPEIDKLLPFKNEKITKYAEPFVGGGAVLFHILSNYKLKEIYISDNNADLIDTYISIRDNVNNLIDILDIYQKEYLALNDEDRKNYFLEKRTDFNKLKLNNTDNTIIKKSALMIFLNKTCFNGLYRVNSKGLYNVPVGKYKNPVIYSKENLEAISNKLLNIEIICGSYEKSDQFIDDKTFVYFDPPYRPLSKTSNFTSYTENNFDDNDQINLANYFDKLCKKGALCLLSNSDPKNKDKNDNFFDDLYSKYNIKRVYAKRMINSKGNNRDRISEILISNIERI